MFASAQEHYNEIGIKMSIQFKTWLWSVNCNMILLTSFKDKFLFNYNDQSNVVVICVYAIMTWRKTVLRIQ